MTLEQYDKSISQRDNSAKISFVYSDDAQPWRSHASRATIMVPQVVSRM